MSSSFVSCVPRFKEEKGKGIGGRTLGPYSYDARHPANPPLGVIDPARKSQVFVSMSLQRPKPSVDNTPDLVGPGAYNPQYNLIFPDLVRLEQFAGKRSAMFASTLTRFQKPPGKLQTPDVRYTLEQDAAEWNCNRDGGGCWGRAERESGTIALMEKKMREAATLTSAIGVDEEAEASAAKVVVPSKQMDMCFRELTDARAAGQKQRRLRPGRGVGRGAPTPPRQLGGSAWPQQPRGRLRSVMWVCHVPPSPPERRCVTCSRRRRRRSTTAACRAASRRRPGRRRARRRPPQRRRRRRSARADSAAAAARARRPRWRRRSRS